MKKRFALIYIAGLLSSICALGITCPKKSTAPLCPQSGSTLLDETYPNQAFIISNQPFVKSKQSQKITTEYINAVASSYDFENIPQIIIPVSSRKDFDDVIINVIASLEKKNIKPDKIEKIISQISHVQTQGYTWQQDYFESFIDSKTGDPVLREFQSYNRKQKGVVEKIQMAGRDCQISKGDVLKSHLWTDEESWPPNQSYSFLGGEMGGNTEGAPGGFCLTGDNQSKELSMQYCGKKENIIQLQTSWLTVGHVDEIFKIIPSNFNDGRPKECQFSLMSASPKKALELMENSKNKNIPFYNYSKLAMSDELTEFRRARSRNDLYGNQIICEYIKKSLEEGSLIPEKNKSFEKNSVRSVFLNLFMVKAHANETMPFKCEDYIDQATNGHIYSDILKDTDLLNLNIAIQESIDKDKEFIKSKIISRLPQCKKYFDFFDVPDLFYGAMPIEKDGKIELPKPATVNSFLPNPTNSVLMNRTLVLPESGNSIFDSFIENELTKRKFKTIKMDSWDYAHAGGGNIHCSSHSIPYCKPR